MTAAPVPATAGVSAPLSGFAVERVGQAVAAHVAERHLRLLGAVTAPPGRPGGAPLSRGSAGRLVLTGSGTRSSCAIDWSGPVAAPLLDEAGVQAACGIMHVHGRAAGPPVPLGIDYASVLSGVLAVHGLLAAAIGRLRGCATARVRTSVAQAALLSVGQYLAAATAPAAGAQDSARAGGPPFTSADGVLFEIETFDPERWQRFWSLLGADGAALSRGWRPFQHRYATAVCPLPLELHSTTAARSFREISAAAQAAEVSVVQVRDCAELPQRHRPWRIATDPAGAPGAPPPPCRADAHLPLEGVVVVESTRRVQGPLAGHLLRLLGAEVVRIEPPGGDPMRWMEPVVGACSARFLALNRGKRVVEIDIRSAAGQREVRELVSAADVFLHNWAPGKAASFGLDSGDLAAVRPGLVYAHASGWSGARDTGSAMGGAEPLGTDFLVQAYSGLGALVRPHGEAPAPSLMTLTDVLGGLISAEGVLAALLARCRGERGARVDSGLYDAAAVLADAAAPSEVREAAARGRIPRPLWGPLHAPLPTRDGYLALGPSAREDAQRLVRALDADRGVGHVPATVAAHCRPRSAAELSEKLRQSGLSATPVCTDLAALAADNRFADALDVEGAAFVGSPWEFAP